jgi:BMFP domain-containing protein YqiC
MFDPKQIDEMARDVLDKMPSGLKAMQADVEKNLHGALQAVFAKLDLVTREEFDVQSAVLARTREKLEALEQHVAKLEEYIQDR